MVVVDNFSLAIFKACNFLPCFDYLWFLLWGVGIGGESYSRAHTCVLRLIGCFSVRVQYWILVLSMHDEKYENEVSVFLYLTKVC